MTQTEIIEKILNIIPKIGVTLFGIVILCLVFAMWGVHYEYPLKIGSTSLIGIAILIIIEKSLK